MDEDLKKPTLPSKPSSPKSLDDAAMEQVTEKMRAWRDAMAERTAPLEAFGKDDLRIRVK